MKYLLIVLLIFTSSCRHIENSLNKLRGEDYSSFLNDNEIKQYDSLTKLVFYHPDSYQDSIKKFNFFNHFELYCGSIDTLKKYNTNKIVLCYDGIYRVKNKGKVIDTPYGYLIYKIENTEMKLRVGITQQFNLDISMSLDIRKEKTCKFWKWDYY
jgi:hypothetical protein